MLVKKMVMNSLNRKVIGMMAIAVMVAVYFLTASDLIADQTELSNKLTTIDSWLIAAYLPGA